MGLRIARTESGRWAVFGELRRGEERMGLTEPLLIARPGFVVTRERIALLALGCSFQWIAHLRKKGQIEAPDADKDALLAALLEQADAPPIETPEELRLEEVRTTPRPCLKVRVRTEWQTERLVGELAFDYGGRIVPQWLQTKGHYAAEERRFYTRDLEAERAAAGQLLGLGMKCVTEPAGKPEWQMAPSKLPRLVRDLLLAGWHIEAEGKTFRAPGGFRVEISTGIDWFELHGSVEYGETSARLPALLEALRHGENMVRLDDGT
ncbi:MAG: hypothetical protein AAB225_19465 [Acidobacteriota bacterium]